MNIRQQITQFLSLAYVFISIYVMENFIGDSQFSFPIVVVLSGSMEPAFR